MLGKLIKYELEATGRKILPLYAIVILMGIILKISWSSSFDEAVANELFMSICLLIYIFAIAAVSIVTLYVCVERFYKNLLGTEGYLMNTLPVQVWQNISAKLIVTIIWKLIGAIIIWISFYIVLYDPEIYSAIYEIGKTFFNVINFDGAGVSILVQFSVYLFVSSLKEISMIYAAISIGHLAQSKRILYAFAAFLVLNVFTGIANGVIGGTFAILDGSFMFMSSIICNTILFIIFFVTSNYIVGNKLNLE